MSTKVKKKSRAEKDQTWSLRDWTPVRRGDVFCSPACGHGCKHADYAKACREATRIALRLGPGWKPQISENIGWHWRIFSPNGWTVVSKSRPGRYTAGALNQCRGAGMTVVVSGKTPKEALLELQKELVRRADIAVAKAYRGWSALPERYRKDAEKYKGQKT